MGNLPSECRTGAPELDRWANWEVGLMDCGSHAYVWLFLPKYELKFTQEKALQELTTAV